MADSTAKVRFATPEDAAACLAVYRPYVSDSTVSFETQVPTVAEFSQRIAAARAAHAWLLAELDGAVVGYAYGTAHRARQAYRYSVETSVYVAAGQQGRGLGRLLYAQLFAQLVELGYFHAFAGITMPNAPSIGLHQAMGFQHVGDFPKVGFKHGQWRDVSWWHRPLRDGVPQ